MAVAIALIFCLLSFSFLGRSFVFLSGSLSAEEFVAENATNDSKREAESQPMSLAQILSNSSGRSSSSKTNDDGIEDKYGKFCFAIDIKLL